MAVDPQIVAALIAAIPASVAVYYARGARKAGNHNAAKIHELSNGVMDEKIKTCVREVFQENPIVVTEAMVANMIERFLNQHLEETQ